MFFCIIHYHLILFLQKNNAQASLFNNSSVNQTAGPSFSSAQNSRPSSVVGDFYSTVVNIDTSNAKAATTVTNSDLDSIVRGNVIRNNSSGTNKFRFSTESEHPIPTHMPNKDGMSKNVVDANAYEDPCIVTDSRPFLIGHSRAASADISCDPNSLNSISIATNNNLQQKVTSKMSHHIRNNSVDNSHVTSVFSTPGLTVKQSNTPSTINNQPQPNKPAIPLKPTGIVSVFVPGSNTAATGTTLTTTSNASKKAGISNIYGKLTTTTSTIPAKVDKSDNRSHFARYPNEMSVQQINESSVHHPIPPPRKVTISAIDEIINFFYS